MCNPNFLPRRLTRLRMGVSRRLSGFTLVELLVVIGIIALLISILLPSLQAARRAAQRTTCAAKLHSIMIAAQLHRQEHKDYYPLAGALPSASPAGLDDAYSQKYDYFSGGFTNKDGSPSTLLAPITNALELEMASGRTLWGPQGIMGAASYSQDVNTFLDPQGMNAKYFLCPGQASTPFEIQPMYELLYITDQIQSGYVCQPQSYIFNEHVVGFNDAFGNLRGKGSLIHQPAVTMFAADGNGGSTVVNHQGGGLSQPMYTVYNTMNLIPCTLADALSANFQGSGPAGDKANFDLIRHKGKMNIAFCDGHVETRSITAGDLSNVWISAP